MDLEQRDLRARQRASMAAGTKYADLGFRCVRDHYGSTLREGGGWAPAVRVQVPRWDRAGGQDVAFYVPRSNPTGPKIPLVVFVPNPYEADSVSQGQALLREAVRRNWAFLIPDLASNEVKARPPGSPQAVDYLWNAIRYAQDHSRVDTKGVYLVGRGGGGQTVLMLLDRYSNLPITGTDRVQDPWGGVILLDPITDLTAWHAELLAAKEGARVKELESFLGGAPDDAEAGDRYLNWSPIQKMRYVIGQNIDLYTTIRVGGGVRPLHHIQWFDRLARNYVGGVKVVSENKIQSRVSAEAGDGAKPGTWSGLRFGDYGRASIWLHRSGSPEAWKDRLDRITSASP
jgi:hypothetical protein